jgi:GTP-binding protein
MFVDVAKVSLKAGNGGDGAVSFRHEKYVANGGPDGGDGGKGGDVVFAVDSGMRTLMDFRYRRKFAAEHGGPGRKKKCHGKNGPDLVINVPPGTVVKDADTGRVLADLVKPGQRRAVAKGGRGGKGNMHFATSTRQAPRFSVDGIPGEELTVTLELKSIADVGLIGYPNVGKSTILSVLTSAAPKIADYPFTTLTPNLGVVDAGDRSFVLADIPGLIDGAAQGVGLGHDFLRHIERTRLLLHVLDGSGREGRDPLADFEAINRELAGFSEELAGRPQMVLVNKSDLPAARENYPKIQAYMEERDIPVYLTSAAKGEGFDKLIYAIAERLDEIPVPEIEVEEQAPESDPEDPFTIDKDEEVYVVSGPAIDRLMARVNLDDTQSLQYFQRMLKRQGVIRGLRKAGINEGDTVRIKDMEFDFIE